MSERNVEQKRIETWFLAEARTAGVPIPTGEVPGEKPDFRFQTPAGSLGIELTEVMRPTTSNHGILPLEEESFHRGIIEAAQSDYYAVPNAEPVHVSVYFTSARGKKSSKDEIALALSRFVHANAHRANPVATFMRGRALDGLDTIVAPDGFDSVVIVSGSNPDDWCHGEVGGITLTDIRTQVEARIASKDKFVETYRSSLPRGSQLWLLLYTGVSVAQSIPIPQGAENWRIPFQFDRVFWFTSLERNFVEIQRK